VLRSPPGTSRTRGDFADWSFFLPMPFVRPLSIH
jgi:hypothetical protein